MEINNSRVLITEGVPTKRDSETIYCKGAKVVIGEMKTKKSS
jgi:hypothetical protein